MPTTVRPPLGPTKRTSPGQTDVLSIFTDTRSPTSKLTADGCDPLGGPKELFAAEALRLRPPPCSRRFSLFALPRTWCAGMAGGRARGSGSLYGFLTGSASTCTARADLYGAAPMAFQLE